MIRKRSFAREYIFLTIIFASPPNEGVEAAVRHKCWQRIDGSSSTESIWSPSRGVEYCFHWAIWRSYSLILAKSSLSHLSGYLGYRLREVMSFCEISSSRRAHHYPLAIRTILWEKQSALPSTHPRKIDFSSKTFTIANEKLILVISA